MKRLCVVFAVLAVLCTAAQVHAQEGETWLTQEKVYQVVLIKIHRNMGEKYLNNLVRTWIPNVKEAMKEGLTLDYKILSSITFDDGYNLILITEHPNLAALDATDEWRRKIANVAERAKAAISEEESDKIVSDVYPEIRTILSAKLVREIKFVE